MKIRPAAAGTPSPPALRAVVASLRAFYGKPDPPAAVDPFAQIVWENVAYLASDARRAEAFGALRRRVGLDPRKILEASDAELRDVGRRGILPADSARKLREIARIAVEEMDGKPNAVLDLPEKEAKRALRKFPSIGEPGADKILVFAGTLRALALDSNALRVLRRIGFGEDGASYAATYRSVQNAVAGQLPRTSSGRIEASQLLRRHGQELCKATHPRCEACPLVRRCAYALGVFRRS